MNYFEIMDGAMGSELIKRGVDLPEHIWSANANLTNPDIVKKIHREYISLGSQYITANTFRTTPRAYKKIGLSENEALLRSHKSLINAIKLAKSSAKQHTKILGSLAPLEDCYKPELFPGIDYALKEFLQLGLWLKQAEVDILLLESMNSLLETELALKSISNLDLPIWVSFVLSDENHLLSGDLLSESIKIIQKFSIDCILVNCSPLDRTLNAIQNIINNWGGKWGVYPNLGVGEPSPNGNIINYETMKSFNLTIKKIIKFNPSIIGGCCGSSSKHIQELYKLRKI